ncbi:alpha/beta hydrolase YcfP [Vibrio sp. ABG19]|uniref:alpha/beta hydrolase YcfP n=1 Tax=Vibrio sp. ABG19 TaxID=2817385 RepID=UPI00249E58FE|nr:alpha/beta hydrolase YcfP [Vibrio sp. ABG19]WGY46554.1 alpha/beta hydrolase [Vibrio sp. ABG19]
MIIYLHGFDSTSPGNHEKVLQLQFIDDDVRFINYSTLHPKHDMQHLLKEVHKAIEQSDDLHPLICGVGLGGYWSERIGFLCGIKQVIFNPNLHPERNMVGRIDRPEEYDDIATKCVEQYRVKNKGRCLVVLSRNDERLDNSQTAAELQDYYQIIWDDAQSHKFKKISHHLQAMKAFKNA